MTCYLSGCNSHSRTFGLRSFSDPLSKLIPKDPAFALPGNSEATQQASRNEIVSSLFWRVLASLLAVDAFGLTHNFARMRRFVVHREVAKKSPCHPTVLEVCKAINYACVWYPKRVLCLQRAIVTTCLLRGCGFRASMVVGAQILPFKAHAWTEVDEEPINERRAVRTIYQVLERW
ncbi:MAG: lasso peptide biosynthesis B2 protein [Terriglobales bacterium]